MKIHKEGYKIILFALILLIILNYILSVYFVRNLWISGLHIVSLIAFLMILFFFRDPIRELMNNHEIIYAGADGRVVEIVEEVEKEYFKDKRIRISTFMSPLNVHKNLYPMSGVIMYSKHHEGRFIAAFKPKSSEKNERHTTVIKNEKGQEILVRQIAGAMARRIVCYAKKGEKINQNDQLGFIKFGSRVDVFLPLDSEINITIREKVKAGKTELAKLG